MNRHREKEMLSSLQEIGEESIYFHEAREQLVEDDVLSVQDDGFMQGYETSFPEADEDALVEDNELGGFV